MTDLKLEKTTTSQCKDGSQSIGSEPNFRQPWQQPLVSQLEIKRTMNTSGTLSDGGGRPFA